MRLRLTHYEGSPPSLSPGWYELPPHLPASEIGRLLDLLATMLDGVVDIVQCSWLELERLGTRWGPDTLVHVAIVPGEVDVAQRDATLRGLSPRLGLFSHARAGHRDASAWLETTIKSALAAWLRRTLRRPEHPLAALGVAALPLDMLIAATSEPVELLELVEHALELAIAQAHDGESIDWTRAARRCLGRRLAQRLQRARAAMVPALLHRLELGQGTQRRLDGPEALDELVRIGLAVSGEGEVLLAPLARLAAAPDIADMLAREGMLARALVQPPPVRERATSPAEAARAFDPHIEIGLDDAWFVDLDAISPTIRSVGLRLRHALLGREDHARVALVVPRGLGLRTMLAKWVRELEARGLVVIRVPFDRRMGEGLVEVVLAMHVALLERILADAEGSGQTPSELSAELRFLRANLSLSRSGSLAAMLSPAEREAMVAAHLTGLATDAAYLRHRGRTPCLIVEGREALALLRGRRPLPVHVVVELDIPTDEWVGDAEWIEASEASLDERRDVLEAVLAARAELPRVFADPAAALRKLVARTSRIDRTLTIAQRACIASEGLVSVEQLAARAAPLRMLYLSSGADEQAQLFETINHDTVDIRARSISTIRRLVEQVGATKPDVLHMSTPTPEIDLAGRGATDADALFDHLAQGLSDRTQRPRLIVLATSHVESLLERLTQLADLAIGFADAIPDDVARESMLAFYERAFAGATIDAALAHAREVAERLRAGTGDQLRMRARPEIDTATYVLRPSPVAQQPE